MSAEVTVHAVLCFIGLALTLVRLRIAVRPGESLQCQARWWAWVFAHVMWALGFFNGMTLNLYQHYDPSIAAWFVRTGLVAYLLLRGHRTPEIESWLLLLRANWRAVIFGALAVAFGYEAMRNVLLRRDYVVIVEQSKAQSAKFEAQRQTWAARETELLSANEAYRKQSADFARLQREGAANLEAARKQPSEAMAALRIARAAADKSAAGWMQQYAKRPDGCKAALQALEATCPALRDY